MKNYKSILLILSIVLFTGCTAKMETNYLPNGVTEYKDDLFGDIIIVKFKNGYCLPDASMDVSRYEVTRELKLSKECKVLSVKDYLYDGQFLQELNKDLLAQFSKGFNTYIIERKNIEAINR